MVLEVIFFTGRIIALWDNLPDTLVVTELTYLNID